MPLPATMDYRKFSQSQPTQGSSDDIELSSSYYADENYLERIEKLKEVDSFIEHLKSKATNKDFPSYYLVSRAEKLWMDLQSEYEDSLPIPLVSLGIDGSILYTFRSNEHYVELEVVESGVEFFYENEETNESVLKEIDMGLPVVDNVEPWLLQMASAS